MLENRLFQTVSTYTDGIALDSVASDIFKVSSGSEDYVQKLLRSAISTDKRFNVTKENKLILSREGVQFKDLFQATYIAFDLETTGVHTKKDKITELGAIKIRNGCIIDTFETLVNPGRYIPYDVSHLTGIVSEMVENSPTMKEVLPKFLDFIEDNTLIAHNAAFDVRFINSALKEGGYFSMRNDVICTCKLGRHILPELNKHSLRKLARHFGIINIQPHRAGSDAATCAKIFLSMLNMFPEKGFFTSNDLMNNG